MDLKDVFSLALGTQASDLHLSSGLPPMVRISGKLLPLQEGSSPLQHQDILGWLNEIMGEKERAQYASSFEVDFSFEIKPLSRFRVNAFTQARGAAAVFRVVPNTIPELVQLKLPPVLSEIAQFRSGLVLFTGATGCGKSTTLAAMIHEINKTRHEHIITIEDPIEFIHLSQKSLINQREVHRDTLNFASALRSALREDPDIILVGELRDLETMRLAMTAAETGHLVLASLHTNSAASAVHRIIDLFPGDEKTLIRAMLAESLRAVVTQKLLGAIDGGRRVAACEVMLCNPAIKNLIREGKVAMIPATIQTGQAFGMQTMDQHLRQLVEQGRISLEEAMKAAFDKGSFE